MLVACIGKRFALDLFDASGGIGGIRRPAKSGRRDQHASESQNTAPIKQLSKTRPRSRNRKTHRTTRIIEGSMLPEQAGAGNRKQRVTGLTKHCRNDPPDKMSRRSQRASNPSAQNKAAPTRRLTRRWPFCC